MLGSALGYVECSHRHTCTVCASMHKYTHTHKYSTLGSVHVHTHQAAGAATAVAFNVDRWQIKKTYWLNLSSSAAIHLRPGTTLLAFNRKCKRMEIVSRQRDRDWIFSPIFFFFIIAVASYPRIIEPHSNPQLVFHHTYAYTGPYSFILYLPRECEVGQHKNGGAEWEKEVIVGGIPKNSSPRSKG